MDYVVLSSVIRHSDALSMNDKSKAVIYETKSLLSFIEHMSATMDYFKSMVRFDDDVHYVFIDVNNQGNSYVIYIDKYRSEVRISES
jgi:hypothetical protein